MKYRIAIWASVGFMIAGGWALYAFLSPPPAMTSADPIVTLVKITCPIAVFSSYPLRLSWVLIANAVTYGLLGLGVETLRRRADLH